MKKEEIIQNKIKYILLFIMLAMPWVNMHLHAQASINTDGSSASASAMLELKSTGKGFLPPHMTETQIQNIVNPANALMVFNTTDNKLYIYISSATTWKELDFGIETITPEITVSDYDGNVYSTIQIGTQIWMTEDLRVSHYPNGDAIPLVTGNSAWAQLADNDIDDAYCFYNNDNTTDYGALYTYAAAIGDNWIRVNAPNQGVCPDGWHLPTRPEWETLIDYLGNVNISGAKMKEAGTTHWDSPNTGASNSSGFTALGSGNRYWDYKTNYFDYQREHAYYRSATPSILINEAHALDLYYKGYYATLYDYKKSYGFSVRCIKD